MLEESLAKAIPHNYHSRLTWRVRNSPGCCPAFLSAAKAARGVVSHRISGCDYFIVATKTGYDVLEWFGGHDPDKGDILIGGFESYGFHDIYDETADADLRVWTEDYDLTKEDALEKLTEQCG
jgi:hypothetical protein